MSDVSAIFAGTFDPVTNGHLDVIERSARLFGRLHVAVALVGRETVFSAEERIAFLVDATRERDNVTVGGFEGLVIAEASRIGATVLVRGVRGAHDWDYEMQMAFGNRHLAPASDTVFFPPSSNLTLVSGSLVREVARLGGDVTAWVPEAVAAALAAKYARPE